jgi:hypothetical protein
MRPLITQLSEALDAELIGQGLFSDMLELPDAEALAVRSIEVIADRLAGAGFVDSSNWLRGRL